MTPSLSVVIAVYNEEVSIAYVVDAVLAAVEGFIDYEIIVVNDASTDKTAVIVEEFVKKNNKIRVIHNPKNMNWGYSLCEGVRVATKNYVCMLPGDGDILPDAFKLILRSVGKRDLVLAYHGNSTVRVWLRRFVSSLFIHMMNALFGLQLRYYNGPCIFPTERLKQWGVKTYGFAYIAELVVLFLKDRKHRTTYLEVPMMIRPERKGANLQVFRPWNFLGVLKTIVSLFWRVQIVTLIKGIFNFAGDKFKLFQS
ncbi:MAG: hypothetical protein A2W61_06330 [Deltaproteobacteria bacterium RIFCSPLOWO2_01_44_7]|nr:MAG: hypothetical protein A2712_02830 [Deltaproteobacteria bacterium RIFCSPHIGHO2_01_FULL_43_49]OGQ16130.1 MAG: hypothetical protein A3D22_00800 [Deltaproteobacteria bacterium RIFCSPHIGHO2_02_FULL_44_53]OGQ29091.1 MAG: hypothetical protein A3D98_04585 [Deltaproteobacteria bacterium RIFCSPHIGHO2_12_FULL_44_21]OGQ32647.1 MAG: hypothetical protein A2979_08730 [Deltaproteobacteria bacterium RIFCSPLOWO2_01_FULL_45_74]OGQ38033.1 MAG: hypothetical protein A2W61_06330 [Deltaproteobacteria bacterium 